MRSGDSVLFPAPGTYFVASTVKFGASGIRVKCEAGAALVEPNRGTDNFANLQSNTAIGGLAKTGCIFRGGGIHRMPEANTFGLSAPFAAGQTTMKPRLHIYPHEQRGLV
jgi:hypothetical protein